MYEFNEDDWQAFRKNIPIWQDRFMTSLIGEYTRIMMGGGKGSDKFWMLKKRIDEDVRKRGVQIEIRRSRMVGDLISLMEEGAITEDDLDVFTDELKDTIMTAISIMMV